MKILSYVYMAWDMVLRTVLGIPLVSSIPEFPYIGVGGAFGRLGEYYLRRQGYTAVINMRTTPPISTLPTLHLATRDWKGISCRDIQEGIAYINQVRKQGGKVYIHCRQGIGRGPSMVVAYLMSQGNTQEEALEMIKRVRGFVHLNKIQRTALITCFQKNSVLRRRLLKNNTQEIIAL